MNIIVIIIGLIIIGIGISILPYIIGFAFFAFIVSVAWKIIKALFDKGVFTNISENMKAFFSGISENIKAFFDSDAPSNIFSVIFNVLEFIVKASVIIAIIMGVVFAVVTLWRKHQERLQRLEEERKEYNMAINRFNNATKHNLASKPQKQEEGRSEIFHIHINYRGEDNDWTRSAEYNKVIEKYRSISFPKGEVNSEGISTVVAPISGPPPGLSNSLIL